MITPREVNIYLQLVSYLLRCLLRCLLDASELIFQLATFRDGTLFSTALAGVDLRKGRKVQLDETPAIIAPD